MNQLKRLEESIAYVEERLEKPIDIGELASTAVMSRFHYQRMFHLIVGMPVGEYIRRRRLTRAAGELVRSSDRVIDIALRFGYETPEAFTTAFRRFHGINPSEARQIGRGLRAQPRISFHVEIAGGIEMEYRVEEHEAFMTVGYEVQTAITNGENLNRIPAFWGEVAADGRLAYLDERARAGDGKLYGICVAEENSDDNISYAIAVQASGDDAPGEHDPGGRSLTRRSIPAATWAIFESVGPVVETIQETWRRIFAEWFPSTNYEHGEGPELEVYFTGQNPESPDHRCEVWVPIRTR